MAQKLMKRCSASLAVWNMQIQTTVRGRFTPTRLADFCSLGSLQGCRAERVVLEEGGPDAPTNREAQFWIPVVLQGLAEAGPARGPELFGFYPSPSSPPPAPTPGPWGLRDCFLGLCWHQGPFPGSQMCLWLQRPGLVCRAGWKKRERKELGVTGSDCPSLALGLTPPLRESAPQTPPLHP